MGMYTTFSMMLIIIFVVVPAVLGISLVGRWRETELKLSDTHKLVAGGLFLPLWIFVAVVIVYGLGLILSLNT